MTPIIAFLLAIAPALLAQTSVRDALPAAAGTSSIRGVVSVLVSGQPSPVRRARVMLQTTTGAPQMTDTDTNGQFAVTLLPAGTYRVIVDKPGFVQALPMAPVEVKDGEAVTTRVTMQPGAAIDGRLTLIGGEPAMGLVVSAMRLGYGPYGRKPIAIRQTATDDLGRFRLHTLQAGNYYIEATPDPLRMMTAQGVLQGSARPGRTYFSGTSRLNDARMVTIGVGEQMSNIDFTVTSAVLATVSARVTTSSGAVPATFSLRVQRVGAAPGEVRCLLGLANPNDNGFTCPNIPPGDFWFLVTAKATADSDIEYATTRVTVDGRDALNLPMTTSPGAPVTGRVDVDGGGPLPATAQVAALETEYEFPSPSGGAAGNTATPPLQIAADGTFSIRSVAGPRLIRVMGLPAGWSVKSVTLGDTDITDTPVMFSAADQARPLRVVVTSKTGNVTGTVTAGNRPAGGARVVIFSTDPRRWGARSRFIQSVETGTRGQYSIAGLLPGQYVAAAVDALDDGAWEDPDVLTRLLSLGVPVTIAGIERLTIDLRVK